VADRVMLAGPDLLTGLTGATLAGGTGAGSTGPGSTGAGSTGAGGSGDDAAGAAAALIAGGLDPVDDVHASGEYRRRLVRVLTARALREAYARATGAAA